MKEKFSATTEEVKEKIGLGKQDPPTGTNSSGSGTETKDGNQTENGSDSHASSEQLGTPETYYQKFKANSSAAFNKLKEMKIVDLAKKGYDIVKDELTSNPNRRRKMRQAGASAAQPKEVSLRTDIVVVPKTQSAWSKKWETFKDKMRGLPIYKKNSGYSEPVVTKSQETAEDMREHWETSDLPVVHKIQEKVSSRKAYATGGIFFNNKLLHVLDVEVRETKPMGDSPIIIVAFQTQQIYCAREVGGAVSEGYNSHCTLCLGHAAS